MSKNAELRRLLWELIKSNMPVFSTGQCYEAVVRSVDTEALTCEVSPADEDSITITARLTSVIDDIDDYLVVFPTVGSTVLVQAIKDDPDDLFVTKVRAVSEYRFKIGEMVFKSTSEGHEFNGGELGGMTITPELKTQLDVMTARIDTIIDAITNAAVAPTDGGATFKANMIATLEANPDKEDFSHIENDKVKH